MEIINDSQHEQTSASETIHEKVSRLQTEGYNFRITDYISEAIAIFKKDMGMFIGFSVVYLAISVGLSFIPVLGTIASLFISPPLAIGFAIVAHRISKDEAYGFNNFFDGFQKVLPLFLGSLITLILVLIGSVLLLIPGIYLAIAYTFVSLVIWFTNEDFWESMEISRKIITKRWFHVFGFAILLGLLNLAGLIALGVGMLFTLPISAIAIYVAFKDVVGIDD